MTTSSNNTYEKRLHFITGFLALGTLALALYGLTLFPAKAALQDGWQTPIIAFELARSPTDLAFLSGASAQGLRAKMAAGQQLDQIFPFFYAGLLLVSLLAALGKKAGIKLSMLGIPFCIIWADLWENAVIGSILDRLNQGQGIDQFLPLMASTWTKWGLIGLSFLLLAHAERKESKLVLGLGLICFLLTVVAGFSGSPVLGEAMALSVSVGLLVLMVRGIFRSFRYFLR